MRLINNCVNFFLSFKIDNLVAVNDKWRCVKEERTRLQKWKLQQLRYQRPEMFSATAVQNYRIAHRGLVSSQQLDS